MGQGAGDHCAHLPDIRKRLDPGAKALGDPCQVQIRVGEIHTHEPGCRGIGPERLAPLALLGFSDISANSGLQSSVLDTVPDTRQRSIEQETEPRPTDESLKGAIEGPATSSR